jgi:hypothetical protein
VGEPQKRFQEIVGQEGYFKGHPPKHIGGCVLLIFLSEETVPYKTAVLPLFPENIIA